MSAHNVVLGGRVQRVQVSKLARRGAEDLRQGISLGPNPAPGRRENLPDGIDGHVIVGGYSFTEGWLELTVNLPLNAQAKPPAGLATCPAGKAEKRPLGQECHYLIGTGNVLLSVSWSRGAEDDVRLYVQGYSTNYVE